GAGPSDPINATISVEKQENGKYTMQLKNFKFELAPGYALGIGNITINDVEGTDNDGITVLSVTEQPVTITPGDDENVDWSMGEQLAQAGLKATINGEMTDDKLYAVIQLPLASVTVTFGTQISTNISSTTTSANSGIEAIYDINGNKLNSMKKGLNILKKADGTTVKVIKK
uniref:calycin-like domain-containing protein n=1 Tax=Prevotella sp. TaxID=59823 RepID=UPI003AB2E66D